MTQAANSAAGTCTGGGYKADVEFDYLHDVLIESLTYWVESVGRSVMLSTGFSIPREDYANRCA